jgi:GRAM domain-containing protein
VADIEFDQKGQFDQIQPWVLENERLHAVYDCKGAGTGFVGITNKRIIFYDKAFMRKRKALVSVPYSKITMVSSIDQGRGLWGATSELVIKTGSEEFEFEFRGGDKAQRAYRFIMAELLQNEKA